MAVSAHEQVSYIGAAVYGDALQGQSIHGTANLSTSATESVVDGPAPPTPVPSVHDSETSGGTNGSAIKGGYYEPAEASRIGAKSTAAGTHSTLNPASKAWVPSVNTVGQPVPLLAYQQGAGGMAVEGAYSLLSPSKQSIQQTTKSSSLSANNTPIKDQALNYLRGPFVPSQPAAISPEIQSSIETTQRYPSPVCHEQFASTTSSTIISSYTPQGHGVHVPLMRAGHHHSQSTGGRGAKANWETPTRLSEQDSDISTVTGTHHGHPHTAPANYAPNSLSQTIYSNPPPPFKLGARPSILPQRPALVEAPILKTLPPPSLVLAQMPANAAFAAAGTPYAGLPPYAHTSLTTSPSVASTSIALPVSTGPSGALPAVGPLTVGSPPMALVPAAATDPFADPSKPSAQSMLRAHRSSMLNTLTDSPSGFPTLEMAMNPEFFPFFEGARVAIAVNHGVVKLSNIPWSTKRSEVIAWLGKNAKLLKDHEEPIHIIMDRSTSKTMDAYAELVSLDEAMRVVNRHHQTLMGGRLSRLGDRPIDVELSSQAALMKDLFPTAHGVFWDGSRPQILTHSSEQPWNNFRGFVSDEEMTALVKHVEVPHRSPFSKECPQRPFECLISTLKKMPWYMTEHITLRQRYAVHRATCRLVQDLRRAVQRRTDDVNLTPQLLKRVVAAAMSCPGFTVLQKDNIASLVQMNEMDQRSFGQPRFAESWRHMHALMAKPGVPLDVLEWYIAVIREETTRSLNYLPLRERNDIREKGEKTDLYFGYLWQWLHMPIGPHYDKLTLADAARMEYDTVERILARALCVVPPVYAADFNGGSIRGNQV